ncbi:hypothetical protein TA3x_003159 [Tundrisphaera sp. TA3]|uniref:hypothetical protein n=1 Tax=Tundrisphaera sp. TA3 TaxID=3435775 RepID=UPI003EC0DDE4
MPDARPLMHGLATLVLGGVAVVTPLPINLVAFGLWAWLVGRWARRPGRAGGRSGVAEWVVPAVLMIALLAAAEAAPVKVVDRMKARRIALPRRELTLGEMAEPDAWNRFARLPSELPADLAGRVVRFPEGEITIGEFIAAVERQTPLRHRFGHCGNGSTILWGGDCSFGLSFLLPGR